MKWNDNEMEESMASLDYLVRAKAFDLYTTSNKEQGIDEDSILTTSIEDAQAWYEKASEEEKEELRRKYPEDQITRE